MHAPQVISIVLMSMSWFLALSKHGEPKEKYHAGWATFNTALTAALLYWGGFWK